MVKNETEVTRDQPHRNGVQVIGVSGLVHIGQAMLTFGGTVDYFLDTVFNYPTLAECYKTAALGGLNRKAG